MKDSCLLLADDISVTIFDVRPVSWDDVGVVMCDGHEQERGVNVCVRFGHLSRSYYLEHRVYS